MCGIIGVTSLSDIQDHILSSLKRLEYRGYDSSGIATISNNKLNFRKSEGKIKNLSEKYTCKYASIDCLMKLLSLLLF